MLLTISLTMSVTPSASSRYASPAPPTPSTTTATATPKPVLSKQKAVNVFSNDGSFLERFQRPKKVGIPILFLKSMFRQPSYRRMRRNAKLRKRSQGSPFSHIFKFSLAHFCSQSTAGRDNLPIDLLVISREPLSQHLSNSHVYAHRKPGASVISLHLIHPLQ